MRCSINTAINSINSINSINAINSMNIILFVILFIILFIARSTSTKKTEHVNAKTTCCNIRQTF